MARITHNEMYQNRLKVIEHLKKPTLRKAKGELRNKSGGRCCLGHMCDALGIEYLIHSGQYRYGHEGLTKVMPKEGMELLGMYSAYGDGYNSILNYMDPKVYIKNLVDINDDTSASPQKIALYLEKVILGGDNTPWKKIRPTKK